MGFSAPVRAAFWMSGALLSFMAMAVSGRELSAAFETYHILFYRSVIGVVLIGALIAWKGTHLLKTEHLMRHGLRNIAHYAGQYGWFYGLAYISLAEVIAIEFTTPVWTALFAFFLLGERLTPARLMALVLGLTGLVMILRPTSEALNPAAFAVLAGAVGYAFSYIQTKALSATDAPLTILFYMTLMQLPFGMVPALMDWQLPSLKMLPWVVLVGVTAMTAHYCMTRAFKLADATVVVPMDFLRLPLIMLVGLIVYQESVDIWVLAGAAVMFSGNLINVRAEQKKLKV